MDNNDISQVANDPEQCVVELAQRVFRGILDCVSSFEEIFMASEIFNKQLHLPLLVRWSTTQLTTFSSHFTRFLLPEFRPQQQQQQQIDSVVNVEQDVIRFRSEITSPMYSARGLLVLSSKEWTALGACLRYTLLLCRRLEKQHFSLMFCLEKQLSTALGAAIEGGFRNLQMQISREIKREEWQMQQLEIESAVDKEEERDREQALSLTSSALRLYDLMHEMIRNVNKIISPQYITTNGLRGVVTDWIVDTFKVYIANVVNIAGAWVVIDYNPTRFEDEIHLMKQRGESVQRISDTLTQLVGHELSPFEQRVLKTVHLPSYTTAQQIGQIADVHYITCDLIPRVRRKLEKVFGSKIEALYDVKFVSGETVEEAVGMLCRAFGRRRAVFFLDDILRWSQFDYSKESWSSKTTGEFQRAQSELLSLKNIVMVSLGEKISRDVIEIILDEIICKLCANHLRDEEEEQKRSILSLFGSVSETGLEVLCGDLFSLLDILETTSSKSREMVLLIQNTMSIKVNTK